MARTVLGTLQDILIALQGGGGGSGGGTIGGALEATQQTVLTRLNQLYGAVDGLEITSDAITLNADQIRLQTDQLEALVTQGNFLLGEVNNRLRNASVATTFSYPITTNLQLVLGGAEGRRIARIINTSAFATFYLTYDGRQPEPTTFDYDDLIAPGDRFTMDGYDGSIYIAADIADSSAKIIATQFTTAFA